jgi:hypothetical protein
MTNIIDLDKHRPKTELTKTDAIIYTLKHLYSNEKYTKDDVLWSCISQLMGATFNTDGSLK